ncbi:MAG: dihydrodipicolinate synthase family protein [Pleurocapsa minor GSE-CHR-MK-17-07R]|jgi:4-hydroxy-tetrahydrodipicolinate synthase|nr:dihydrodipicolinate synthase family protein [Pleurocapsa minor GSE-CHR-MK 17-07R]
MSAPISGIFNILATPFASDNSIDEASLRRLVEFQLGLGAYGLTILGVLGEAAKLSVDERRRVMDIVLEVVNGRVPVIVGASHDDLATCIALSQSAISAGATGVMIAPPRMASPTDDDIITLYSRIAEGVSGPIVVQDFPPVNGVIMKAEMLARLAEGIPNARYLKLEDPPLMEKIGAIRALTDKFMIFGGLGGMFLLEELGRGASGTMTGFAFTEILVAVYQAWIGGDKATAERIFDAYLPLIRFENQPIINLNIRKELLRRRGAIADARLRVPFVPIDGGTLDEIDWIFRRVGIADPTQKIAF